MKTPLDNAKNNILSLIDRKEKYLEKGDLSEKTIKAIESEIDTLWSILFDIDSEIEFINTMANDYHKALANKDMNILCLEAICIIHGIDDIRIWLKKGLQFCLSTAIDFWNNQEVDLSIMDGEVTEVTKPARIIQIPAALCPQK